MKIIFMGTPEFALPSLSALIDSPDHQIVSVFTAPPKAKGRGLEVTESPIHKLADIHNIPVHNPITLRSPEATNLIDLIAADVIVVVAYGFIIPKAILAAKKYGCLNIHPSLLPKYRGAAPLQRTIINGEQETAVCIMQMDEGLDTGDIILEQKFALGKRITLPALHDQCAKIGAQLLLETLAHIDTLPRIPQKHEGVIYASKLTKEEGKINWQDSAWQVDCRIRGMNPWPGVYFTYQGKNIKILEAESIEYEHNLSGGTVIDGLPESKSNPDALLVACGSGVLQITKLQQAGKTPLLSSEFIRGLPIPVGSILL